MNFLSKKIFGVVFLSTLIVLGYEVAIHESSSKVKTTVKTTAEKIQLTDSAFAQGPSLDRGFADLVKRVIPGVVNISTYARPRMVPGYGYPMGGQNELFQRFYEDFFGGVGGGGHPPQPYAKSIPIALGTGFIIDAAEGLIVTNNHVVQGAEEVKIQFREEETELAPAEIIGRDPELDVALLKVKIKSKLIAIPLGDSDLSEVGEYVLAIGNPLGYGHTVSHGILSAKGRRNPEFRMGRYLQTDASINPGNSGGPLINSKGEVIGINNAIDARAQGIGFAIPINLVKSVLSQLKSKGSVSRGFLGIGAADLTPEVAEQLGISSKIKGVLVSNVQAGLAADEAGIIPYDVITEVNGELINNSQDLTAKISSIPIGETAKIGIVRAGKPKNFNLKIAERPLVGGVISRPGKGGPPKSGSGLDEYGFRAEDVILEGKKAVIISQIAYGSPAANAGLNRGDIILDLAGKEVHSVLELDRAIRQVRGPSMMIRVKRSDPMGNEFVSVVVLSK